MWLNLLLYDEAFGPQNQNDYFWVQYGHFNRGAENGKIEATRYQTHSLTALQFPYIWQLSVRGLGTMAFVVPAPRAQQFPFENFDKKYELFIVQRTHLWLFCFLWPNQAHRLLHVFSEEAVMFWTGHGRAPIGREGAVQ